MIGGRETQNRESNPMKSGKSGPASSSARRCRNLTTRETPCPPGQAQLARPPQRRQVWLPVESRGTCYAAKPRRPASVGNASRSCRCGRRPRPRQSRQHRFPPWPSGPAVPSHAWRAVRAPAGAACTHTDRIWRDRRTPTTCCRPSWRSPRARPPMPAAQVRQGFAKRGFANMAGDRTAKRTSDLRNRTTLRLPKAGPGVRIEALPRLARSLKERRVSGADYPNSTSPANALST
jgi:hypothetical protein